MYNDINIEEQIAAIDLASHEPADEHSRELYYIGKLRALIREKSAEIGRALTACTVTFGCQMNARDSEKLAGILARSGFVLTDSENADFVIFNTCTVRDNADQRTFGHLGRISHLKKKNPLMKVAVCGCMMQEPGNVEKIKKSYPFVDLIFGTHNIFRFAQYLYEIYDTDKRVTQIWQKTDQIVETLPIERKYPYRSGINIMFGCDKFCSYCIVPYVRGRERSRDPKESLREAENLARDGVTEIMLLGQNVNSYGKGLDNPCTFAQLLEEVCRIEGIHRVRFMTPHPTDLSYDVIEVIRDNPKVARHVHLPLQSGSDRILKRMNRHYTKEQFIELARRIREEIPDVSITTDIIVGFPGETAEDVAETLDVIERVGFDNAYTFIYSPRRGTPAAAMKDQVPAEEVKVNFDKVLSAVQRNAAMRAGALTGRIMEGLVEEVNERKEGYVTCRLSNNMVVHIPGDTSMIGSYKPILLEQCRGFYFFGRIADTDSAADPQ